MKEYYTIKEFAEIFGVTERTVRQWIKEEKVNFIKIVGSWRISKEEVEKLKKGE